MSVKMYHDDNLYKRHRSCKKQHLNIHLLFTLFSLLLMLFCTKSSPLFAFNDWFDANVYFTMGKGMMNGRVPYVDLIDNKGPLLYFIYGISWLIDHIGFTGVYIFQSFFLTVSLIFVYRLALLFISNEHTAVLVALCSPMPMLIQKFYADNYDFGGGGPDEFCRTLMIVSLFYFTFYYESPDKYRLKHTVLQGILFMCVFLIKFNLTVFWLGFLLVIACELLYQKKFLFLLKHIGGFFSGAILCAIPYLIYGLYTNSLDEFVNTYFLYNWTYVNPSNHMFLKVVESILSAIGTIGGMPVFTIFFSIGIVFVFFVCRPGYRIGYTISLFLLFVAIYYTTVRFAAIHISFTIALIFGMIATGKFLERYISKCRFPLLLDIAGTLLIFTVSVILNGLISYDLFLSDKPTAQQQIADVIWERNENGNPTLLEIGGLDSGFYTASGILPDEPYFFVYNISEETYPYPYDAQKKAVKEGHTEFVISRMKGFTEDHNPYDILQKYDEICVIQGTGYQSYLFYHLYQIKEDH